MKVLPYVDIEYNPAWARMMMNPDNKKFGRFENLPHIVPGRWG